MGEGATSPAYPPENEFDTKPREQFSWQRQEEKRPAKALSRTCSSITRSTSGSTLTRTLSIRKSTSVREGGYRRINDGLAGDQTDHDADHADQGDHDHDDEEEEEHQQEAQKGKGSSNKKKGKLRRACKKLFGF